MKTKMFLMVMMMTMVTSSMGKTPSTPNSNRFTHTECTCKHECRKCNDNRHQPGRCPTCGKEMKPSTTNWHSTPPRGKTEPIKKQPNRSFGNSKNRSFGSNR